MVSYPILSGLCGAAIFFQKRTKCFKTPEISAILQNFDPKSSFHCTNLLLNSK